MKLLLNKTLTSIGSLISNITSNITRRKGKYQEGVFRLQFAVYSILFFLFTVTCPLSTVHAITDPNSIPNNKFGIHIISPTPNEASDAAALVNSNGDWGYTTFLIQSNDRNESKWQEFFNELRRRHLIPIVRLATKPVNTHWERPYEKECEAWADFLDKLNWPVKNRYVVIYNEPNHGAEWGNTVDAKMYAKVLDETITELKNKNRDFFVLNAGFDASAPHEPPQYFDEEQFLKEMEKQVPGIFEKLDGWATHSYPNPGFAGSPNASGRGTIKGWIWEKQILKSLGVKKDLAVFITETGWAINNPEKTAEYYKQAFESVWDDPKIVAVTPFILNYTQTPFDKFSFKKDGNFLPQYQVISALPKQKGQPIQESKAKLEKGEVYRVVVAGQIYDIPLTFKNTGQSIWNSSSNSEQVKLKPLVGEGLGLKEVSNTNKVEPGQEITFNVKLMAPPGGTHKVVLQLFEGDNPLDNPPFEFDIEVKPPASLIIKTSLKWKKDFSGQYSFKISGPRQLPSQNINLSTQGISGELLLPQLLPDYTFDFTLEKENYYPKTISKQVLPGLNVIDFDSLDPDIWSAIFNPQKLWKLLFFTD